MILCRLFPDRKADRPSRLGLAELLIAAFLSYLCLAMAPALLLLIPASPALSSVLSLFGTAAVLLPVLALLRLDARGARDALYLSGAHLRARQLLFLPLSALFLFLLMGALLLVGAYGFAGVNAAPLPYLLLLFLGYLVQGSAEELLCRGLLMSSLSARYGGRASALISAAFFSLMHIFNPALSLFGLVNIFLFGLLFAALTQQTKSLLPACLFHAGWNFSLSLVGVEVSGNAPSLSLFVLESRIPLLTGGGFGMEASPLLTALLLLSLFLLACRRKAKK